MTTTVVTAGTMTTMAVVANLNVERELQQPAAAACDGAVCARRVVVGIGALSVSGLVALAGLMWNMDQKVVELVSTTSEGVENCLL